MNDVRKALFRAIMRLDVYMSQHPVSETVSEAREEMAHAYRMLTAVAAS